jgi:PAS domain-containing protein
MKLSTGFGAPTGCTAGFTLDGLALRDKEGRIVRWYYLMTDVDDRKRAEEALKQSEVNQQVDPPLSKT